MTAPNPRLCVFGLKGDEDRCAREHLVLPCVPVAQDLTTITVKFPPDDLEILEAVAAHEKLRRSDIIRRAVRDYARSWGLLDAKGQLKKR